jgi:Family of unknown function (DUF5752)
MATTRSFVFIGCVELREILGRRAQDERELMEALAQVPLGSIYYHTHSVFLRHPRISGAYPNDFASWVATQVRDQPLAERLAVVDPFQFVTLEELRDELVAIIDEHVTAMHTVPRVLFGNPLSFIQSHLIEVATGFEARTLEDFRRCVADVDQSALYLHALHSRVARHVHGGDFARWIGEDQGRPALAEVIAHMSPYLGGLERMRQETLRLLDAELGQEAA